MMQEIEKQEKYDIAYLKMAREWAQLSFCERKKKLAHLSLRIA